ncbi:efflux RND transporter periplasmic adaptor subunit [Glacieibacterium sp.]|uniref:efflux RND transporter periplasmic adaptor subunit n=1 Tax=Glacieibacterium sp. TaxID=2860237 RepID=UPI003B00A5F0
MTDTIPVPAKARTRRRLFLVFGLVLLVGAIAYAVHAFFFAPPTEQTDDAYVAGDVVAITSREAGTVIALHADNTQAVKRGQPLLDLDPATADVNLSSAAAELARAVRSTRSNVSQVDESQAQVAQAQAELSRASNDLSRRRGAAADGAVSGEEVAHAADTVTTARASLRLAQSRLAQSRSTVQGVTLANNPAVLAAIARYRNAAIMRGHMHLTAPVDGIVAQRTVQLGQQVAAGTPLMAVVPLRSVWVDANFRETQLGDIRIGQPATITTDIYGGDTVYHGRVIGLGAGSGNAFALLPPQNASGNWIKIVQRVPVRVALDPRELDKSPLRLGLSVDVTVDTHDRSGSLLATPATGSFQQQASQATSPEVEAEIRRIVAANSATHHR